MRKKHASQYANFGWLHVIVYNTTLIVLIFKMLHNENLKAYFKFLQCI